MISRSGNTGTRSRVNRSIVAPAGVLMLALMLGGCLNAVEVDEITETSPPAVGSRQEPSVIELIVLGDSLASGGPWDAIPSDPGSWTYSLGDGIEVVGGWRRDGATSRMIAGNMSPDRGDAVAIMAGTNDIRLGIAVSETVANIDLMVSAVNVDGVVIAAVPPQTGRTADVRALNSALASLAAQRSWSWVDPWASLRVDDEWAENASPDGIHGSAESYKIAGAVITAAVETLLPATDPEGYQASSADWLSP